MALAFYGPYLAYNDETDTILPSASFFLYKTYDDALADLNRQAIYDDLGVAQTVLKSTAKGVIPRWQAEIRSGFIRAGDNIQEVISALGVDAAVTGIDTRVTTIEDKIANGTIGGGAGGTNGFDFQVDPSNPSRLVIYAVEGEAVGTTFDFVVDSASPTRMNVFSIS